MYRKLFLLIALAIGLIGISADSVAAQQMNMFGAKSKIERKVRSEILSLPYYGVFDAIGYQISGDTVTLNGYVVRPITKSDAENSIEDIDGVSKVVNNIEVLPLSPNDDRIRRRVLQTLTSRGGSLFYSFMGTNPSIRIIVKNGRVSLEGYVDNRADSNLANILTKGVSGTFGVTNNLQIINEAR
ncbi:MAG: BON domain-containing protein [Acidobacteriota bacterium]|nr:BON domain-containing protein [Acidobacteriota bacterium]